MRLKSPKDLAPLAGLLLSDPKMVGSYMPLHNLDVQRSADLSRQVPHLFPNIPTKSRLAVLRDEHKVISQPKYCMRASSVLPSHQNSTPSLLKASPKGEGVHPSQSGTLSLYTADEEPIRPLLTGSVSV